jgi:DNA-binding transcriptional ArsR family regulator
MQSTFETLADPTRRLILATLRVGELPVGEIVDHAGIHQSGVSRHLRIPVKRDLFRFVPMASAGSMR